MGFLSKLRKRIAEALWEIEYREYWRTFIPRTLKEALRAQKMNLKMRQEAVNPDTKCPQCNSWESQVDPAKWFTSKLDKNVYVRCCRMCSNRSLWDFAMAPVPMMLMDDSDTNVAATIKEHLDGRPVMHVQV